MKLSIFIIAACIAVPNLCFGWGATGHQIVANIAKHYIDSATRAKVQHYLGSISFEDAGTWMDRMRSDQYYDYMKTWHYIDIEKDSAYARSTEKNLATVLNSAIKELMHKETLTDAQIKQDLLLIFHLTGDLTQPLHTGYPEDKGGNTIDVSYLYKHYHTNLHSVWDNEIIDSKRINMDSAINLYPRYTEAEIKKIKKINVLQWMNDSRSYLPAVYDYKDGFIDAAYVDKNYVLVEQQLLKGGLRLANILEAVFNKQ
jgi:hypothetical protein